MTPTLSSQHHTHSHDGDHGHKHLHVLPHHDAAQSASLRKPALSVLAWPAWLRVVAVLPLVLLLWLAVLWANEGVGLW